MAARKLYNPPEVGGIYIFTFQEHPDFVKIGLTRGICNRLMNHRSSTPYNIDLLLALPIIPYVKSEAEELERTLHHRFTKDWHRSEWFTYSSAIDEYINSQGFDPYVIDADFKPSELNTLLLSKR